MHAQAYEGSAYWYNRLRQPIALRFLGAKISVSAAPDPSNVMWQNLEVSSVNQWLRRRITACAMLLLIAVSFSVILAASSYQVQYAALMPKLDSCDVDIPAAAMGGYARATAVRATAAVKHYEAAVHLVLGRPETNFQAEKDTACVISRKNQLAFDLRILHLNVSYDMGACVRPLKALPPNLPDAAPDAVCIVPGAGAQCPCALSGTSARCNTYPCFLTGDDLAAAAAIGMTCGTYPATTLTGCYCLRSLQSRIEAKGSFAGLSDFLQHETDVCLAFAKAYASAEGLLIAAAVSVSVVNVVLKIAIDWLAAFERHHSVSGETAAATLKIFLSQFVNTGLVITVANFRPAGGYPSALATVLSGQHGDFDATWYYTVGGSISLTVLLNCFIPHACAAQKRLLLSRHW